MFALQPQRGYYHWNSKTLCNHPGPRWAPSQNWDCIRSFADYSATDGCAFVVDLCAESGSACDDDFELAVAVVVGVGVGVVVVVDDDDVVVVVDVAEAVVGVAVVEFDYVKGFHHY